MVTVIIFALIGVGITTYLACRDDLFLWLPFFLIGATIGGAIGVCVAFLLPSKTEPVKYEVEIVCLQDGSATSGSFFLGCGNIKGEMYYTYYSGNGDSTYSLNQIYYRHASVKYSSEKPRLLITKYKLTADWYNKFSLCTKTAKVDYTFEVPRGAIKTNYNLDAQ
jgi:hypothetical protein